MGMCRKVQMRKIWREGQRRSPRISALDAWKGKPERTPLRQSRCSKSGKSTTTTRPVPTSTVQRKEQQKGHCHPEGPASRTRGRKKRKLRPLQDVASSPNAQQFQDSDSSNVGDGRQNDCVDQPVDTDEANFGENYSQKCETSDTNAVQSSSIPLALPMPKKRILELVIDTLQRRDTHEIFAEPVDPDEVEEYYEIIKEPMDFGTMRAKLHEGMYHSLEQFEHDAFLITRNAMHFNSSSTIYFRQARAIDELAKKVFHVLKTDPENFELEFSGTRRRSGRRPQSEAKNTTCNSSLKPASISRSRSVAVNISPKPKPLPANVSSNFKRFIPSDPGCSGTGNSYKTRDNEALFGGGVSSSFEADRRSTYKPWMSFLGANNSIVSTVYDSSKLLVQRNQQNIGYRKSLMSFVKDLGPVAQRIAERKLNEWQADAAMFLAPGSSHWLHASGCQSYVPSTTIQCHSQNLSSGDRRHMHMEVAPSSNDGNTSGEVRAETHSCCRIDAAGVSQGNKFNQNRDCGIHLRTFSFFAGAGELGFAAATSSNKANTSTTCKLEKSRIYNRSQSQDSAFKDSQSKPENDSFPTSSWPLQATGMLTSDQTKSYSHNPNSRFLTDEERVFSIQNPTHGFSDHPAKTSWESSEPWTPGSSYAFGLPFLRTQLEQINTFGQDPCLVGSGIRTPLLDRSSETCNNENHPRPSLDARPTNLALQL